MTSISSGKSKAKKFEKLLSREEEFKRLNAELEEKTAHLINQAECVLRGQDELFQDHPSEIAERDVQDDIMESLPTKDLSRQETHQVSRSSSANEASSKSIANKPRKVIRPKSSQTGGSKRITLPKQRPSSGILQQRVQLASTISTFEEQAADEVYTPSQQSGDVPEVAEEMGAEATIRFLKAKLRVMQEELDRMAAEINQKDTELEKDECKVKELTDELSRQLKLNSTVQSQMEKYKKLFEEAKQQKKANGEESSALRKDLEDFKRQQKQANAEKNAVEVRLNRALEELQRNKQSLVKAQELSKDSSSVEKKRVDQLAADNKRLEKQKSELMSAFKKQLKLIDILKRQKMHLESAKMLQFSEEEFVKALDWGN